MKISVILGTRPEIIKMSPIIRELESKGRDYFILRTGQHYTYSLDKIFFEQLELPLPKYDLDTGSGTHAEQTAKILVGVEKVLIKEKPDVILAEGDTNTVFAGALAASKLHIKVGHVEAGLRSDDRRMPEEINRILTDHISDYLFAPTQMAKENLLREGIHPDKIFVTGNSIVDAVYRSLELARQKTDILGKLKLKPGEYFLLTAHRQENVDDPVRLKDIFEGLKMVSDTYDLPVLYSVHPRTEKRIKAFKINIPKGIRLIKPVGFLDFLQLLTNARLVLTDSGGVQEETCILNVPCVTLRDNTERPETIEAGGNVLAGVDPANILKCVKLMIEKDRNWSNPFGDGTASKKIIDALDNS